MARTLTEAFPDAETLLRLEPEELGDVIMELIHADGPGPAMFSMPWAMEPVEYENSAAWPQHLRRQVKLALAEAFGWLEHAGLIMSDPDQNESYRITTRRGRQLRDRQLVAAYRAAAILPLGLIHPDILARSYAAFLRGDHDIAVFAAFKALEVSVRKAGEYEEGALGTKVMRKAFEPMKGPLADKSLESGEQQAQSDLFAGAIGAAKNPASHRDVEMGKVEAARLIVFASYLMSIVEARSAA